MKQNIRKNNQNIASRTVIPKEKFALAKSILAKGATDAEFELLLHVANKYHLDPLLKEVWCIKRSPNEPAIIMTSRDGYLTLAHRTGKFDGMQSGTIEDSNGKLMKAWAEVWRKDMSHSFKAEVRYSEYTQNSYIWQKYPSAMLIKVAEVFALKRAFSISGMLTQEEMGYEEDKSQPIFAESILDIEKDTEATPKTLEEKKAKIFKLGRKLGLKKEVTKETVETKYKLNNFEELADAQAEDAIKALKEKLQERQNA